LNKANELEKIASAKITSGIIFCPFDMTKLMNSSMVSLLELIDEHDKVYVLKKNEIFELNINKTNHSKTLF